MFNLTGCDTEVSLLDLNILPKRPTVSEEEETAIALVAMVGIGLDFACVDGIDVSAGSDVEIRIPAAPNKEIPARTLKEKNLAMRERKNLNRAKP